MMTLFDHEEAMSAYVFQKEKKAKDEGREEGSIESFVQSVKGII